ncbi:MAG: ABC transporter permease [Bacillota bacterium]|nr:ABC transporter permease [Bacillota bacterium]
MNKLLRLVFLDFKLLTKNKTFYLKLVLFPAIMILILGTIFKGSDAKLPSFDLAFYSEDSSISYGNNNLNLGTTLENKVLKSKELSSMINIKEVSNYNEGKNLVDSGKASVFVYIPKDFTKAFTDDTKISITLIGNKNNPIDKSIVNNILNRFIQNTKTVFIEEKTAAKELSLNNTISKEAAEKIMNQIARDDCYSVAISKVPTNNKAIPVDGMQYYSIAMVVMFSIITAFTLVHGIVEDRLNNTLFRIKSTPTLNLQYALGKLAGIIFAVVMQMGIVIIITGLVFKMKWGNPLEILLVTMIYAFSIGTMVLLLGFTAKNQDSVTSMASPILYGFSFLGGSFISKYGLPDGLKIVQEIIPNGKAINSYLRICQGGGIKDIYMDLIELVLIGLVFLVISLKIYSGRKWNNNANVNNDKKAVKAAI